MFHRRTILIRFVALVLTWILSGIATANAAAQGAPELKPAPGSPPASTTQPTAAIAADDTSDPIDDADAAYTRAITERSAKIVASLGIADADQEVRVRDLLVKQYRGLREIHDVFAAKTAEATRAPGGDSTVVNAWVAVARVQTSVRLLQLHRQFVARLAADLSPAQVDKVKDGMTYGVVQATYNRYLEMIPNLSDERRREILAQLLEAREYAMDAGSAEEKHRIFGQYKGRINNYLSQAGYDLKQLERELSARQKPAAATDAE